MSNQCRIDVKSMPNSPVRRGGRRGGFEGGVWGACAKKTPHKYRIFITLEKGTFVFQKSLSETPLKPDRVSFCTPNIGLARLLLFFEVTLA